MTGVLSGAAGISPFHEYWAARATANAWCIAGALTLPAEVLGFAAEVAAFGANAAFADISNRSLTTVSGPDTAAFLAALSGESEQAFAAGGQRAVIWCGAGGFARGAGRIVMRAEAEAVLVSSVSDRAWLRDASSHFAIQIERAPAAGLRLAGPITSDILEACVASPGPAGELVFPGLGPVLALSPRPDAMDLWVEPQNAHALAWMLERAGARPAGAKALNAWRVASGLLAADLDWTPAQWCVSRSAMRTREHLTGGAYVLAAWSGPPPPEVHGAVSWTPQARHLAISWQPSQPGRAQSAPSGGSILGPAATD